MTLFIEIFPVSFVVSMLLWWQFRVLPRVRRFGRERNFLLTTLIYGLGCAGLYFSVGNPQGAFAYLAIVVWAIFHLIRSWWKNNKQKILAKLRGYKAKAKLDALKVPPPLPN